MANQEAEHIKVQHILIGFRGSVPGKPIVRSKEEAQKLAYDLLAQAQGGADFDALVRKHTDDSPPGIYGMSNRGVSPGPGEYPRDGMVPAFGNAGFPLGVGEIGIADFDQRNSPYGWHIVKRLS
jgi:parvulin-like peptidyl-prolyl isomerase